MASWIDAVLLERGAERDGDVGAGQPPHRAVEVLEGLLDDQRRDLAGAEPNVFVGYDGNDWAYLDRPERPSSFTRSLEAARASATDLQEEERGLRERLALEVDLLAGGAGLRVQRPALSMAGVAALLAAAALGVSAVQLKRGDATSTQTLTVGPLRSP